MLKIIKDVAIRHDGREIYCKAGQIVNVRSSFDINEDVARGVEIRYADKFRLLVKLVNTTDKSNITTLSPVPNHNVAEQQKREEDTEFLDPENDQPEKNPEEYVKRDGALEEEKPKRGRPKGGKKNE